jgi:conjugal transfer pilus assembly protein TraB
LGKPLRTQKLRVRQLAVAVGVGVLGLGLYTATGHKEEARPVAKSTSLNMGAGLRGDSLEEKLRGDLKKVLDGQQLLGDRISAIEEGKVTPGARARGGTSSAGDGDLPAALPGSAASSLTAADRRYRRRCRQAARAAHRGDGTARPPAPPVEKTVGAIGSATSQPVPQAAGVAASLPKKIGRSICRLVS